MNKRSKTLLVISVLLVLISMLVSGAVQTSFGGVDVKEISLVTKVGTLTGYLLVPATATIDTPAPAIVASHGYLNNREMQDITYVELSRRGYVVFAMNAYKHGDSSVPDARFADTINVRTGGMLDAVEYLATLPFVDATRIGVTGHSMGGGYAIITADYYTSLERKAIANGASAADAKKLNKVASALTIGTYPSSVEIQGFAANNDLSGNGGFLCDLGIIMAKYDEFFAASGYSAMQLLSSDLAHNLLAVQTGVQRTGALEEGKVYANPNNGYRLVMYNPRETHAQNHFSLQSAGEVVSFFEATLPAPHPLPPDNQIWWMKELFNLVGLVGFFIFLVPFTDLLLSLPFFSELRTAGVTPVPALQTGQERQRFITSIVLNVLLCVVLMFPLIMGGYLLLLNNWLPQDTTGGIGLWAAGCGLVGLLAIRIGSGKFKGRGKEFGIKIPWRNFWKTALLAIAVVSAAYILLFFVDYIYQVDFRIWSFDLRIFSASKIWVAIKYLPFFLVYFAVNSIMISRNTFANWSESKQTWMSVLFNILAPVVFLAISYLPLLFNGYTFWGLVIAPGSLLASAGALGPILMIPFVPILGIAGYLNIKLYRLTGSIWMGALLNALLITMITVANTSFSFPY
ncbi:MAG: dienelactone hydrolase family protein [Chloroflexi bacterium]|nr:dienelactone hydrolase family protein [Chloroflexota bacterium]